MSKNVKQLVMNVSSKMMNLLFSGLLLLAMSSIISVKAHAQNKSTNHPTYTNPVLNFVFADPSVIEAPDGWFYAYATRTWHEEKEMIHLQIAKSKDLVHWKYLKDGMPVVASWANNTHQFWAPDIHYDEKSKIYYLYYASAHNGTSHHCIGIATSKSPGGPFGYFGRTMPVISE